MAAVGFLTLRNLRLKRVQGLIGGAADSADQGGGPLHHRVHVLTHETLLQFDDGGRVRQAKQLLRSAQVGAHDALDQACDALLHVAQATLGGMGQRRQLAHILRRAMGHLGYPVAHLLECLGRLLSDLALALGDHLRAPAHGLVCRFTSASRCVNADLGALARHLRSSLDTAAHRLVDHLPTLPPGCRALAHGISDLCPAPGGRPSIGTAILRLAAVKVTLGYRAFPIISSEMHSVLYAALHKKVLHHSLLMEVLHVHASAMHHTHETGG